jgi:putative ABC transport system substrate-binding protein
MQRRDALAILLGATLAFPLAGRAEQNFPRVVGYLDPTSPDIGTPSSDAFRQGLRDAGYVEGRNLTIESRWAEGHFDRLPVLAGDLVGRNVDLIATVGEATVAAKGATSTIPIVFMGIGDPVAIGLVASLARPGGNLTGFSNILGELMPKRLELLAELVPHAKIIALLVNPNSPGAESMIEPVEQAARLKGVQIAVLKAGTEEEIDAAFTSLVERRADALLVSGNSLYAGRRVQILRLASRHAVPAMYPWGNFPPAGGLISYGIDETIAFHEAGSYAGRILNGAKPAQMPVQQPTGLQLQLMINLKTAQALGLAVPQSFLIRARKVFE